MSHSLALTRAGRILAWGADGTGQLGNGGTADRHLPVQVHLRSGVKVTAIAAGQDYSMAVTADGGLLAWGGNSRGQLGTGTKISTVLPVSLVLPLHTVAAIIGAGPVSRTSLAEFNPHLTP
jgi:alpha-tubulin suppressor-like RCC1 family protein